MNQKSHSDVDAAHKYFSAYCFNQAWELMDKPRRTTGENELMLLLNFASRWHWLQRPDCTPTNESIGYWQTSRIYALLGQAENARRYAQLCLETSQAGDVAPFYIACAYEALARAAATAGDEVQMQKYLTRAKKIHARLTDPEEKEQLASDLKTIHIRKKALKRKSKS